MNKPRDTSGLTAILNFGVCSDYGPKQLPEIIIFSAAFAVTGLTILNVFCNAPVQISIFKLKIKGSTRQRWSKYGLFLLRYKPYNILVRKLTKLVTLLRTSLFFRWFLLTFISYLLPTHYPDSKLSLFLSLLSVALWAYWRERWRKGEGGAKLYNGWSSINYSILSA